MSSVVDLYNQALSMLGDQPISSVTEDTEGARLCHRRYEYCRDSVLRAYPWNGTIVRVRLAQNAATPAWGYDHYYNLPADCLTVRKMQEADEDGADWKVENTGTGRAIATDSDTCHIQYQKRITDLTQLEPLLREAIAARLAAEIAYPLTSSSTVQAQMWELYRMKLREAKGIDAQEGNQEYLVEDTWLNARL